MSAIHTLVLSPVKGGGSDEAHLGLVTCGSLAGGKGSLSGPPCTYCGEIDGHTGQCPIVSLAGVR